MLFQKSQVRPSCCLHSSKSRRNGQKDNSRPALYSLPQIEETQIEETQIEETQIEETQIEETQIEETQDPFELAIQKLKEELDLLTNLKEKVSFIKSKTRKRTHKPCLVSSP